jgi:hypothetical protein
MSEFINSLSNKTWFVTIVSFLIANLGTILSMGIVIIRNKLKNDSMKRAFDEALAKANIDATATFNDQFEAVKREISAIMNEQLEIVQKKLKIDSDERKEAVAAKSIEVKDLIDSITKQTMATLQDLDSNKVGDAE